MKRKFKILFIIGTVIFVALEIFYYVYFNPEPFRYGLMLATIVPYTAFILVIRELILKNKALNKDH